MPYYELKLDDGTLFQARAESASEAIGRTLLCHVGRTVVSCIGKGNDAGRIHFDVPPHKPFTQEQVDAMKPARKQRPQHTEASLAAKNKHAPWVEDWMKKNGHASA